MKLAHQTLAAILGAVTLFGAPPARAQSQVAVYRWYLPSRDWHFYTSNPNENPPGWNREGEKFRLAPLGTPGMVTLARLIRNDGGHFYVQEGTTEFNRLTAPGGGMRLEGRLGAMSPAPQPGMIALHRFLKPGNLRHFYTTVKAEGDRVGFRYEGVVGYVYPAGPGGQVVVSPPAAQPSAPTRPSLGDWDALSRNIGADLNNIIAHNQSGIIAHNGSGLTTVAPLAGQLQQAAGFRTQSVEAQTAFRDAMQNFPALIKQLQADLAAGIPGAERSAAEALARARQALDELNALRAGLGLSRVPVATPARVSPAPPPSPAPGAGRPRVRPCRRTPVPDSDKRIVAIDHQIAQLEAQPHPDQRKIRSLQKRRRLLKIGGCAPNKLG